MTIQGAIAELQNLLEVDEVPFYCKGGIKKVIETIQMELADRKTEPTISKTEQVDEPMKTTDYCDICKRDMCEVCIADATNPYCVPSHYEINYEPKDEPQKWETPPKFNHKGIQTACVGVSIALIEDDPHMERRK